MSEMPDDSDTIKGYYDKILAGSSFVTGYYFGLESKPKLNQKNCGVTRPSRCPLGCHGYDLELLLWNKKSM